MTLVEKFRQMSLSEVKDNIGKFVHPDYETTVQVRSDGHIEVRSVKRPPEQK